jgi:3-hydroxyisobutyrate dehydrogenase
VGVPICANLVRAGYRVQAGDRRPEAAELATRCGAQWVSPIARLAAESDVLITVLPGPGEVQTLLARGVHILEAPVGGGVADATQGTLQVLVGGDAEVFARQRDLLEVLGGPGRVIHAGGYGAGYTVKLLINLLWFGQAVATAEALLLGRAAGLDLGVVREALTQSAADSRFIRHDLDALFADDFMRSFGLDRCYEELQTVTELAHALGVPIQLSETVADVYRRAVQRYGSADSGCGSARPVLGPLVVQIANDEDVHFEVWMWLSASCERTSAITSTGSGRATRSSLPIAGFLWPDCSA